MPRNEPLISACQFTFTAKAVPGSKWKSEMRKRPTKQ